MTGWAPGILSSIGAKKVIDIIRHINFLALNSYELLSGYSDPVTDCRRPVTKNKNMGVRITRGEKGCIFGENAGIISVRTARGLRPRTRSGQEMFLLEHFVR